MTDDNSNRPLDDPNAASVAETPSASHDSHERPYVEHDGSGPPITEADVDAADVVPRADDSESGQPLAEGALDELGTVDDPPRPEGAGDERVAAETPVEAAPEPAPVVEEPKAPRQPTPGKPILLDDEDEGKKTAPTDEEKDWYIVKCAVNRETSIREALLRKIGLEGMSEWIDEVIIPVEEQIEFTKAGKRRTVKKKLYPGYLVIHMAITDESRLLVRDTPGIVDFTGAVGKPTPLGGEEVKRILDKARPKKQEEGAAPAEVFVNIRFKEGDKVRVNEGNFQNFEGEVSAIDRSNGGVTVMITIFGRSTPVELKHWQIEQM